MLKIELRRSPGITEQERKRRMHQAFDILLSAARRTMQGAPAEVADLDNCKAGSDLETLRASHDSPNRDLIHIEVT